MSSTSTLELTYITSSICLVTHKPQQLLYTSLELQYKSLGERDESCVQPSRLKEQTLRRRWRILLKRDEVIGISSLWFLFHYCHLWVVLYLYFQIELIFILFVFTLAQEVRNRLLEGTH